jgi:hypothetical protein
VPDRVRRTVADSVLLEFGGNFGGLGRPDPLEDLQCLPQGRFCLGGMPGGQRAPAQVGQRVRLGPGAGDGAGLFQGLLVALLSLREVTAGPVQRPSLVERLGLATAVADVVEDAQGLVQHLGGGRGDPVATREICMPLSAPCQAYVGRRPPHYAEHSSKPCRVDRRSRRPSRSLRPVRDTTPPQLSASEDAFTQTHWLSAAASPQWSMQAGRVH